MKKQLYSINEEEFNDIYNRAEEIHANITLIRLFCKQYYDVDEMYKLKPIIEYTYKTSDILYANLIDIQGNYDT